LLVFATAAVNCCVPPPYTVGAEGVTVTVIGGDSVIVAVAVTLVFAALAAVTVTVCELVTVTGAV
jgi:hypothetical protein